MAYEDGMLRHQLASDASVGANLVQSNGLSDNERDGGCNSTLFRCVAYRLVEQTGNEWQ